MRTPLSIERRSKTTLAILLAISVVASTGCIRRRLTVRTQPAGATVFVDNQRIGTSPCSVDFTYYGTREIRLIKPGYETLTVNQPIPAPAYDRPVVDFFTENVLPTKIRDNRVVSFNLAPQRIIPAEELIGRGQQLRDQATAAPVIGAPIVTPGFVPPPPVVPPPPPGPTPAGAPPFVAPPQ